MNINTSAVPVSLQEAQLLSDETAAFILRVLMYGATPAISLLGVTGNVLSIMILTRHGLHKCSNILLVSLAFTDLCYLVGFNNVPKILYDVNGNGRFLYSEGVSLFLFVLYFVFFLLDYGMGSVTLNIPMLITIERLVAVFLPLKFATIVTPRRTWVTVGIVVVYCLSYMTYSCFWYQFEYTFDSDANTTVGFMARSSLFHKDKDAIAILEEIYLSFKVQPLFTLIGCTLIIIKVKLATRRREKMTITSNNSKTATTKTTQTLLSVCLVYTFVCAVMTLPTYIPERYMSFSLTSYKPTNLGVVMYQVINIVMCMNSSWNFIIYIALNKKFRDTYKELIVKCLCCSNLKISRKVKEHSNAASIG